MARNLASTLLVLFLLAIHQPVVGQEPISTPVRPQYSDPEMPDFKPCEGAEDNSLFKPLSEIRPFLSEDGKRLPPDCTESFLRTKVPGETRRFRREFVYHWEPTNFFHMPVYFDDVPLERYGQTRAPHLQPWLSGARFFLHVPVTPYRMGLDPPHSCVTTLGHQPPGNCLPSIRQVPPKDTRGSIVQAAATVGFVFLLP